MYGHGSIVDQPPVDVYARGMIIRPLHDRIVLRRIAADSVTKGGIVIPENAKEKPVQGEVVAVGSGKALDDGSLRPIDVKVGDRVLFGKYAGSEVTVDGEERVIVREEDILAVLSG